jgi:hypothetical protein
MLDMILAAATWPPAFAQAALAMLALALLWVGGHEPAPLRRGPIASIVIRL